LRDLVLVGKLRARSRPAFEQLAQQRVPHLIDKRETAGHDDQPASASGSAATAASTPRTWAARSGPPGRRPSKMAPPMVNPHAPAPASAAICSTVATDPAAMTGPADAATTARV